ncbi:MAG: hypothetical protein ABI199_00170 [Bacteroidia bacterium]
MNKITLNIPKRGSDNFLEPIYNFMNFVSILNQNEVDILEIDFSKCKFANPFIIGGAASLANSHNQKGGEKSKVITNSVNEEFSNYLDTISFYDGFNYSECNLDELDNALRSYYTKTYIPIVCFPTGKTEHEVKIREKIITAINNIIKNQLGLKQEQFTAIAYLIDELTQNIVEHSGSEKGILFAQFYPTKNYMDVCIVDYGKGLFQSYIDSGKHHPKSEEEAINFAVFGKSTKDLAESRGFGISTSREMLVTGLKGKFFLYSGGTFYIQTLEQQEVLSLLDEYNYKGCYIALRIPVIQQDDFNFYNFVEGK